VQFFEDMQEKLFYIKVTLDGNEKLRMWASETEVINLFSELKNNCYDTIIFNKRIELQIIEEHNGVLTTYYYDNITNLELDEITSNSSL